MGKKLSKIKTNDLAKTQTELLNTELLNTELLNDLQQLIRNARQRLAQAANSTLTLTNWQIGRRLLEENLTDGRGEYGRRILRRWPRIWNLSSVGGLAIHRNPNG